MPHSFMCMGKGAKALAQGKIVVLYDASGREGEADLVFSALHATPEMIEKARKLGGGLICLATSSEVAQILKIPFLTDCFGMEKNISDMVYKKTNYGDVPAFSIPINHKGNKTGISDEDRAKTIFEFGKMLESDRVFWHDYFHSNFRTPGHISLLIGRDIKKRKGHTELSLELAKKAGLPPAVVLCEIAGKRSSMTRENAQEFAKRHGWEFVEGKEITESGINLRANGKNE